jgi:hypothetical protein
MDQLSYCRHRFPPVVIQHAIWLYLRGTIAGAAMTAEQWIVPSRVPGASIIAVAEVRARHMT